MAKTAYDLKGETHIDSREIIEAQESLREDELLAAECEDDFELDDDERALLDFDGETEIGGEWSYGVALIREDNFEDYAREFAEDIGAIGRDAAWPCDCIDWEKAASELAMDYTSVDFLGYTYYVRA